MDLAIHFATAIRVSNPPPGSVNVLIGQSVAGPGGTWIPCVTETEGGVYLSCTFEVGPGRRQVCAADLPERSADEALSRAIELAETAAA